MNASSKSSPCTASSLRILSWNILQGGGRRAEGIVEAIAAQKPDIVTLQEFRRGSAEATIRAGLKGMGMTFIHVPETESPTEHTILVASRFGFDAGPFLPEPHRPLHLLEAFFAREIIGFDLSLVSVHFPQKKAQVPLFKALREDSATLLNGAALLVGDLNCGIPFEDSDSKTFVNTAHFKGLLKLGWTDVWRSRHPGAREFTWVSPRTGNRFRYDHVLASSDFDARVQAVGYHHDVREVRHSDHSLLVIDIDPG